MRIDCDPSRCLAGYVQSRDTDRFVDQRYRELEVERLWKKVWQMACREDDIPNVGDYYIYDIAHLSYIVVRTGEKEFKAHLNVCLHRGRILRERSGKNATEFRCRFHGWSWKIDGSLKGITCEWDFPNVREGAKQLTGAKVGT
jgi:phenylpropionate dioxygenase-like ring-hydroxylating dioxygenase large terminal subunit